MAAWIDFVQRTFPPGTAPKSVTLRTNGVGGTWCASTLCKLSGRSVPVSAVASQEGLAPTPTGSTAVPIAKLLRNRRRLDSGCDIDHSYNRQPPDGNLARLQKVPKRFQGANRARPRRASRGRPGCYCFGLKGKLRRKLQLSWRVRGAVDHSRRPASDGGARSAQDLKVKDIKSFRPNLDVPRFAEGDVFYHGEIHVVEGLIAQNADAEIAERAVGNGERGWIKPASYAADLRTVGASSTMRVPDHVRAGVARNRA